MIKYYRKRLITVAMTAFMILLILVISGVFLFSYIQIERETNRTVQSLLNPPEDIGILSGGMRPQVSGGLLPVKNMLPSSFYDIMAESDGTVISSVLRGFLEFNEDDIQVLVSRIVASKQHTGRVDSYNYGLKATDEGKLHIILMDTTIQTRLLFFVLRNALLIGAVLMILLFIILLPVTAKAAALLAQNTEKQKRFVTDAGHELKTPVAVIRSNLDVMELLQGKSKWSGNIRGQIDRLENLVKQLLLLARLDEQQWTGKTTIIDFSQKLKDELQIYEETAMQKELTISTEIADGLLVQGDEESIRQLLHMLLDNAMQYSSVNGHVWIRLFSEKRWLRLDIVNTMDAVPNVAPERLLDRFTRGDNARSRKNGGTGIGLSTVKSITDLYHGDIRIDYLSDSRFQITVRFPRAHR